MTMRQKYFPQKIYINTLCILYLTFFCILNVLSKPK